MTPLTYAPKDALPASAPLRFLCLHNPFYLLSAMCMLAGCLALTNSLSWTSIPLPRLLALVVTLNVYEALLLALGLYLIGRRGTARDGRMLLLLEAVFLVDAAFLNVEVFAIDLDVGVAANALIYLLAVIKLCVVFRVMGLPFGRTFVFVLVQLTVLFVTPGLFAAMSTRGDGSLPPGLAYAAWWVVGLIAAASALVARRPVPGEYISAADAASHYVRRTYLLLPFVSLVAHLLMMHWVYDTRAHTAYLAPLLVGAAVALHRAPRARAELALLRLALPALAVILSFDAPAALRIAPFGSATRLVLTPFALSLAAAYLAYVYLYFLRQAGYFLAGAAVAVLTYAVGPTPAQVLAGIAAARDWALGEVRRLIPKTTAAWGVVGVAAAFVFLAAGAAVSLRNSRVAESAAAPAPADDAGNPYA